MASYEIEITRTAEKQLRRLARADQLRVLAAIVALAKDPMPRGVRKLEGYEDVHRIRVGRFRILYSIAKKRLVILILKIGHRREAYR
jgi:mRNA interferase RelE/StbE